MTYIDEIHAVYQHVDENLLDHANQNLYSITMNNINDHGHDNPIGDYFYLAGYLSAMKAPIDDSIIATIADPINSGYTEILNTLNQLPDPLFEALHGFVYGLIKKAETADGVIYAPPVTII